MYFKARLAQGIWRERGQANGCLDLFEEADRSGKNEKGFSALDAIREEPANQNGQGRCWQIVDKLPFLIRDGGNRTCLCVPFHLRLPLTLAFTQDFTRYPIGRASSCKICRFLDVCPRAKPCAIRKKAPAYNSNSLPALIFTG